MEMNEKKEKIKKHEKKGVHSQKRKKEKRHSA